MNFVETIINAQISVSMIVGFMIKALMTLLSVLALVMVRQSILMNRVVKLPEGNNVKILTWSFLALMLFLTAIVVLA